MGRRATNCLDSMAPRVRRSNLTRGLLLVLLLLAGGALCAFNSSGQIVISFNTGNYGLDGDGPGATSDLLTDPTTGLSSRITTRDVFPSGSFVHVNGTLGINAPYSNAGNAFDPGGVEGWSFSWDRDVVLNSLLIFRIKLGNVASNAPLVLSIRSEAWIGKGWAYTGHDPKRVYQFDSPSGTFTFTGYPTNVETQTTITFSPADYFDSALLSVPADVPITFLNTGPTYAALRAMTFQIVPEPSTVGLLAAGLCLFARTRKFGAKL